MAMIYCAKCKNEYDNNLPICPYCGTTTPATESFKNKIPVIVAMIIVAFLIAGGSTDFQQSAKNWLNDTLGRVFSDPSSDQPHPLARTPPRERVLDHPSENASTDIFDSAKSSEVPTRYAKKANQLLLVHAAQTAQLPLKPLMNENSNLFVYAIDKKSTLIIHMNKGGSQIETVSIYDRDEPSYARRMSGISAAFIAALLPDAIGVDEVKPQLVYLQQLALASKGCSVFYDYDGLYLVGWYDPSDRSIILSLSTKKTNDTCL